MAGRAGVVLTIDHNDNAVANDEAFHFKTVPAPRQSAALGATFTLIDGNGDSHGSPLEVLHDGKLTNSYGITARFLAWLDEHVKPGIVATVDQVMRAGKYTPEFWQEQTGKSIDDLWQDYGKNPAL